MAARTSVLLAQAISLVTMSHFATVSSAAETSSPATKDFDEIIVTARRVEERQLTVPMAVNAIGGDQLDRLQIRTSDDLANKVPALQVDTQDPTRANSYRIRGIGPTFLGDPGVINYVAEVPQEFYGGAPMFDLASIQVLKGPQGTLFGKNSVGGAVLFVPQRPTQEGGGFANVRLGNEDTREFTGGINLPINEQLAIRLAGRYSERGALWDNVAGKDIGTLERTAGRLSILFTPNDTFENYLIADGYTSREIEPLSAVVKEVKQCNFATPFPPPLGNGTDNGNLIACLYDFDGNSFRTMLAEQQGLGIDKVAQPSARDSAVDLWGVTNTSTVRLGAFTVKNIFGYRRAENTIHRDLDGNRLFLVEQVQKPEVDKQLTEELQLLGQSFDDKLNWVVGAFYSDVKKTNDDQQTDLFRELAAFPAPLFGLIPGLGSQLAIIDSEVQSKVKALFGQATLDLGSWVEGLKFTVGARQTKDDRDFEGASFTGTRDLSRCRNVFRRGTPNGGQPLPGTDPATCIRKLDDSYKKTTYNVNLEYSLTNDTFAYVTTRRGFKSGSFNTAAAGGDLVSYKPETLTDYELGLKSQGDLGSMRYRVNAAVYTGDYDDIQAQVPRFDNGNFGVFIVNVGKAKINGAEIELGLIPVPGLELGAYYAVTDGKYDDDVDLTAYADNHLLGIAKSTAGLSLLYEHQLAPSVGMLSFSSNLNYRGETPTSYETTDPDYMEVGGFATLNATIGWEEVLGSKVGIRVYGQNLTDKRAPITANDLRGTVGYASKSYLGPRMYGLEANVAF